MTPRELVACLLAEAETYARDRALVDGEKVARRHAALLEAALREHSDAVLTLQQASTESGFSADHLRHLVANGALPNAGKKGAPRVRRADLPRKAAASPTGSYDPERDALELLRRRVS